MRGRLTLRASSVWILLGILVSGCAFGPKAIERTHGKYAASVQKVEEEEFLKNIVRLRYVEEPRNLKVTAIAAQYELSAGAEARPFFSTEAARFENPSVYAAFSRVLPFAAFSGSTRPTVSLSPQDDNESVRQFLTPISADTVIFLTQSGWPVETLVRVWMSRLNGVPNLAPTSGPPRDRPADFERFRRIAELMQEVQDLELASLRGEDRVQDLSGPLAKEAITASAAVEAAKAGFEYQPSRDGKSWRLIQRNQQLVFTVNPNGRGTPQIQELFALLNLDPLATSYDLQVGTGVPDPLRNPTVPQSAISMQPRSTSQAMFFLANGVHIPSEHAATGVVTMPLDGSDPTTVTQGLFAVHCCEGHAHRPPPCAYLAIRYRGYWYYIDDRDQQSKATLLLMLKLRQLDFTRAAVSTAPALTLPVGR